MKVGTQIIQGIEYVFEDYPIWDPIKKRGTHKRTYIGKNIDGVFIPNKKYVLQQELIALKLSTKPGPVSTAICRRTFHGATHLLESIAEKTGVLQDLKTCFPADHKQIASLAYYLALENHNPMTASTDGQDRMSTLTGRKSHPSESVNCSAESLRRARCHSSKGNPCVDWRKNTLLMIQRRFLPTHSPSNR